MGTVAVAQPHFAPHVRNLIIVIHAIAEHLIDQLRFSFRFNNQEQVLFLVAHGSVGELAEFQFHDE